MAKKVRHLPNCAVEEVMDKVANDLLCADKHDHQTSHYR